MQVNGGKTHKTKDKEHYYSLEEEKKRKKHLRFLLSTVDHVVVFVHPLISYPMVHP